MTSSPTPDRAAAAALRHPEKRNRPDNPIQRKPAWIRVKAPTSAAYHETRKLMRDLNLVTVCEEAACPNIGECWAKKHATMMIMGDTCTRACAFCNVATGTPKPLDTSEPANVGLSVATLGLEHVVITSVDRDDLDDGGAGHFAHVVQAIRAAAPATTIEISDAGLQGQAGRDSDRRRQPARCIQPQPRDGAAALSDDPPRRALFHQPRLLRDIKVHLPRMFTKSGLMVGLGETREEVGQVMDDLRAADVDFLTIGQYLQPTPKHAPIDRFVTPDEFEGYAALARGKGFLLVSATPLTRSSYHAGDDFAKLRTARDAKLAAAK